MTDFVVKMASHGLDPDNVLAGLLSGEAVVEDFDPDKELIEQVADADVLLVRSEPVTAEVIKAAPRLKLIQRPGATVFDVDQAYAAERGIPVCNIPARLLLSVHVGEHASCLMLALAKRLPEAQRTMSERQVVSQPRNMMLKDKRLGLIGAGRTAAPLIAVAKALGMHVSVVKRDTGPGIQQELGVDWLGDMGQLPEMLESCDFVSIHLPINDSTRGIIGERELGLMRPGSYLINVARAGVLDYDAVRAAVMGGHLAGFAADVWWSEPARPDDDLVDHPAVIATPHVASASVESHQNVFRHVRDNIARLLRGEAPDHCVNGL